MQIKQNVKTDIEAAIKAFHTGNLTDNALGFFRTLGYNTERQQPFNQKTYNYFKEYYAHESDNKFNEEKAQVKNWKYIDLLFQLSHEELSGQCSVFKKEVITKDDGSKIDIESYLFFVIELKKENYTRTALSQINREINKVFSMPVMVLFKYGKTLTLSVIDRRLNKRDEQKDVLKKVTLIKDISIEKPHRAHIEIFFDLSFEEIKNKYKFSNFVELHNAWRKTLNIKELNNKFYNELFKWYLWAGQNVKFPQIRPDVDKIPDETHQNESIIRLLTRLLFCWFMKEKQTLIPEILFKQSEIEKILKGFSMEETNNSVYYRAILQNLFFATLSVPIKPRKYIRESFQGKNTDYGNPFVFRYQDEFVNHKENLKIFRNIPFLNGGLFECLDEVPRKDNDLKEEIRLDGFSTTKKKQAIVPDFLFWGEHKGIDLSEELDDKQKNNETVCGIIDILNAYKFTVEENTPLEEEIALDPELLGKVFENLLASYNPETKSTARKQSGSFYTPREIVNYMVDESLAAYLKQKLSDAGIKDKEKSIRDIISYSENPNPFNAKETILLINAIDTCKILDPACG
ncbi:MAG: hypothetical protein L6420_11760, partial [Elusimicrobia bacterium]|nr:hypothetical protein [Elusimicrobiota bacterium]